LCPQQQNGLQRRLCRPYIVARSSTSNSIAIERTFSGSKQISSSPMDGMSIDPEPASAWRRVRRCLEHVRDWPANGNGSYSLLFCLSLLLAIGLIIQIGH
jgi:hypothetical protein